MAATAAAEDAETAGSHAAAGAAEEEEEAPADGAAVAEVPEPEAAVRERVGRRLGLGGGLQVSTAEWSAVHVGTSSERVAPPGRVRHAPTSTMPRVAS